MRPVRALAALLLAAGAPVAAAQHATPAGQDAPPNVVIILADDLGWSDLACYGSALHETPALDLMAGGGLRFTDAYSSSPNCSPTRAALLTGMVPHRTGIYTVGSGARGAQRNRGLVPPPNRTDLPAEFTTLAEALQAAGYRTGCIGKWHLGGEDSTPKHHGFDFAVGGDRRGHPPSYFPPYGRKGRALPGLEKAREGEYLTDRLTREALAFLRRNRDRPFFLFLSHYAVHTPIQAKPELEKLFAGRIGEGRPHQAAYAAMVASLDESVGRVLAELEGLDLDRRTLVVFTSDNGGLGGYREAGVPGSPEITSNAPLRGGKGMLYEGGIRVPLVVRWPGRIPGGRVSSVPVITHDWFPTVLALTATAPPEGQPRDGVDLSPLLTGEEEALSRIELHWHFPGYLESAGDGSTWRTTPASAIRVSDLKLVEFFDRPRVEFYDLDEDPGEERPGGPRLAASIAMLREMLSDWRSETDAPMPTHPAR